MKPSDNKLQKLNSLQEQGGFWYITKQNLIFRDLCFIAKILESWNDDQALSYEDFFNAHKAMPEYGGFDALVAHRATKNCEYLGLLYTPVNGKYSATNLTPFYYALKNLCNGDFNRLSQYPTLIDKQLERMFVDSSNNVNYNVSFKINPFMFLFKILLLIGDITKKYQISIQEFKLFVATSQSWNDYFEVVESILRYRNDEDYQKQCDANKSKVADVRMNILAQNHSQLEIEGSNIAIKDGYVKAVRKKVAEYELNDRVESTDDINNADILFVTTLQQIYFGAPGTGKSHSINEITEQMPKENVYRTTFHPDSDYSTFVGCYKPTKEKNAPVRLSYEELVEKLKEYKSTMDQSRACTMLGFQYPDSVREIDEQGKIWDLLHAVGITTGNYDTSIRCGWECYNVSKDKATSISYEFVPQTFLKAYMRAYQTTEPVVLVIEEINRGNCAQIFGDLFQLLDRKNGISEYPIKADEDIRKYLINELGPDSPAIANGELCLPSNLCIWATMNTSDQSLFPIDSAFKRRWDWKYMKIANMEKGYKIEVDGKHYDWWQFIDKMNGIIGSATSSEDKKLGYFFCKVEEGDTTITAEQFVSKVLFYVYGDALKDYDIKNEAFVKEEKDGKKVYFTFSDFYDVKGEVDKAVVAQLLDKFIQADEDKETLA